MGRSSFIWAGGSHLKVAFIGADIARPELLRNGDPPRVLLRVKIAKAT